MLHFERWKIILVVGAVVLGAILASPNLMSQAMRDSLPNFLPTRTINLGLDLQGGSHLLLSVDVDAVRIERIEALQEDSQAVLREAGIANPRVTVEDDAVRVAIEDPAQTEAAAEALRELSEPIEGTLGAIGPRTVAVSVASPGQIELRITPEAIADIRRRTVRQSIEIIRRRIDSTGVSDPTIQRQGDSRILVQAPGVDDPARLKEQIGKTAKMSFHMVTPGSSTEMEQAIAGRVSPLKLLLPTEEPGEPVLLVRKRPALTGENLRNASQGFDPESGNPIVNFSFDMAGSTIFCKLTSDNVGQRFATVLDDVVITAPRINGSICGGSGFIQGNFSVESASDLAALLNAGALPAPLTIVEERSVGAQLGADSVAAGRTALMIGFAGVIVFMLVAYRLFGVFANMALIANVGLMVAALSTLGATLTLPGIAGIILTVGMAVDANVLIYERIREEARGGRSPINAIEAGFRHAQSAIIDANITTFIAAMVLYQLGSGPVRGFAVTLAIGILTSVFTAFVFCRLLVALWVKRTRPRILAL